MLSEPKNSGRQLRWLIYSVTCVENGNFLMGVTTNFKKMKSDTLSRLKEMDPGKINLYMLSDYIKYGERKEIFEFCLEGEGMEFGSEEEARIWAWFCTLEEKENKGDEDAAGGNWDYRKGLYNRKAIVKLDKLSVRGKELVSELTGMSIHDDGNVIADVLTGRTNISGGKRYKLRDKIVWKNFRIHRDMGE